MPPAKYKKWLETENLALIEGWARDGLTDEQISHNMGVSLATLKNWKKAHVAILAALKKGKEVADYMVENALFKSACGYDYEEVTEERVFNKTTHQWELQVTKRIKKHQPPSNTAQIFWLKNRKPSVWRERAENQIILNEDTDALSKAFEELMIENGSIQQETTANSGISEK